MSETDKLISELVRNASISRYRHFYQAGKHSSFNSWMGVPVIIINIVLGSTFFALLNNEIPDLAKWTAAGFALIAALLSGLQTFFNFSKNFEGHRKLGNRYLELVRELERLTAFHKDESISQGEFIEKVESLHRRYLELNEDSADFPTSTASFQTALEQEKFRVGSLKKRAGK